MGLENLHIASIVELLVCFFVRRSLTDTPPTRELTRFFMKVINEISSLSGDSISQSIKQRLLDVSASDTLFREKLEGNIYEENWNVTRFVLCGLAEKGMTVESWTNLWRRKNRQFVWSIEHIFPQGRNIPECWVNMIASGNETKAQECQRSHVHRLGNLTISGYNSTLGNKSFEEKRDRRSKNGNSIGYRNGLVLNEDLANANSWSVDHIEKRTDKLVQQVLDIYSLDRRPL